jgi:co-chaperonin GroES (HSP10)
MPAYNSFRLDRDVSPLKDHILVYNMEKGEKITRGGIILGDDNGKDRGIRPRWCQVYKVGANIDYVSANEWILVEHGRWTYGVPVELDGNEFYIQRVDTDAILLAQSEKPADI